MNRRKGVPCGCDADPCGCSPSKHCVKAINNVSPDPNGDLTIKAGAGIAISQTGDDEITIINAATPSAYVEGTNIEFTPSGDDISINVVDDPVIDGTLTVNGDIIQNGAAYETHAEKVFTKDDYIVMRDGAVGALAAGDYSGFQVEKYDGTNDGRLVIDRDGVARVGDIGDEQPLLTRDETADLTNGHLLEWNANESKAVDSGTNVSAINTAINGKVSGTGNIGADSKPVKIVNGQAVEVANSLQRASQYYTFSDTINVTAGQEAQGTAHTIRAGYNTIIANAVFSAGSSGISGFVFGVNIDGTTTWCQSLYQIPANDTVRASIAITYNKNATHQFAIKMYASSSITGASVNTKVTSL